MDWNAPIFYRGEQLSIEVNRARNFTEPQLNRLLHVIERMLVVLNSLEFKIAVTSGRDLTETNGMTPVEVYDLIMSGKDMYGNADGDLDIDITLYHRRWSRVVGYTFKGSLRTFFNRKFWRNDAYVAGNILHEACHNCGFDHLGAWETSVPYFYGDTMNRMMQQLGNGKIFVPVKDDIVKRKEEAK
jgi:hypothetical protein